MIRVADISDLEWLCGLYKELHKYHADMVPERFCMPDDGFFCEEMTSFLNSDEWITLVHEDGGVMDGYVIFKAFNNDAPDIQTRRICHITHFMVTEDARRRGVGTELMNKVCECARSVQCDVVRLLVNTRNEGAIAFDNKLGFEAANIVMEKRL